MVFRNFHYEKKWKNVSFLTDLSAVECWVSEVEEFFFFFHFSWLRAVNEVRFQINLNEDSRFEKTLSEWWVISFIAVASTTTSPAFTLVVGCNQWLKDTSIAISIHTTASILLGQVIRAQETKSWLTSDQQISNEANDPEYYMVTVCLMR